MSGGRKIRFLLGNAALHTCDLCYFKKRTLEKDSRELKEEMVSRCAEGPASLGGNIGRGTHMCVSQSCRARLTTFSAGVYGLSELSPVSGCKVSGSDRLLTLAAAFITSDDRTSAF